MMQSRNDGQSNSSGDNALRLNKKQIAETAEVFARKNGLEISFDKIAYSRSKGRYYLLMTSKETVDFSLQMKLEQRLKLKCTLPPETQLIIRQPGEMLLSDEEFFHKQIRQYSVYCEPAAIPFIRSAKVEREESFIDLIFARDVGPELFRGLSIDRKLEDFLRLTYGLEFKIRNLKYKECEEAESGEDTDCSEIVRQSLTKTERPSIPKEEPAETHALPTAKKPEEKPKAPAAKAARGAKKLLVNEIRMTPTPIQKLKPDTEVAIEGELLPVEMFLSKSARSTIVNFAVTDYTTSVAGKYFARGDQRETLSEILKEGKWYRFTGKYAFDDFSGEFVLELNSLCPIEPPAIPKDTYENKRVELHLHTNMSTQDGMTSIKDYVKRAAAYGYKAMALTDHGIVQAFPDAEKAVSDINGGKNPEDRFKLIYGMEAYLVNDDDFVYAGGDRNFSDEFVVLDIETTGTAVCFCEITEIGAVRIVNGRITDQFQTFVNPKIPIPANIVNLTGITNEMVKDAPSTEEALKAFWDFAGDACLCAHNAEFDMAFITAKSDEHGISYQKHDVLDTLMVARAVRKELHSYKLDRLAKHYGISLQHHRAVNDARATAELLLKMMEDAKKEGAETLRSLNGLMTLSEFAQKANTYHAILLAKNKTGLKNLYKLVSKGHLEYFYRRPRIPKSILREFREGLIVGSACEQGEVFRAVLMGRSEEQLKKIADFYDYMEIQPIGNNAFLIREGTAENTDQLKDLNLKILKLGDSLGKKTVATTDCHYLNPTDEYFRRIIMDASGFEDADNQAPLYFRTTNEMMEEFSYLGDRAEEVVISNTQAIADEIETFELSPHPDNGGSTIMPEIEGADVDIRKWAYERMHDRYGDPLPEGIEKRLERELGSIIKNGFSILYWIAKKLVEKSMEDGYLVGSRGSVGSSLAAYAMGITEVNPLPPHYLCPKCKHIDFGIDEKYACGVDMPPAVCPDCGEEMEADGYDIPFEVFLGIDAEKVPDIDLNFSGDYQPKAHRFIEELFGEQYVYRAGTIGTIKEKTARQSVIKYFEKRGKVVPNAEIDRLARGCSGVKRTTGQHPGGMVIVPKSRDIFEFTPIQHPADDVEGDTITTHFDFNSMHDILVKLDILAQDNPTIIRMLQDLIGFDPLKIPLNDPETLSLFTSTKALGITPEDIRGIDVGTLGIPEFGTSFVRGMLDDTKPTTMAELVRIAGLSHGTDVWLGNAQQLVEQGVAPLTGVICTRDDIMNYLVKKGVEQRQAFFTMESVRKGKWAKHKEKKQDDMEKAMRDANVEEWFIESCRKIGYMFPKAHAVAYVIMSLRIAYCKVHYPREYYATFFTTKCGDFDASYVLSGKEKVIEHLNALDALGNRMSATEKSLMVILELVLEMFSRGIGFLPVDLKKSRAVQFGIEGNNLRLPFLAIPKLGGKAAALLEQEASKSEFMSVDDLKMRCKLSAAVIDQMREMGCLNGLPEKAQLSLFETL